MPEVTHVVASHMGQPLARQLEAAATAATAATAGEPLQPAQSPGQGSQQQQPQQLQQLQQGEGDHRPDLENQGSGLQPQQGAGQGVGLRRSWFRSGRLPLLVSVQWFYDAARGLVHPWPHTSHTSHTSGACAPSNVAAQHGSDGAAETASPGGGAGGPTAESNTLAVAPPGVPFALRREHRPFPAGGIAGLSEAAPEVSVSGFQVRAVVRRYGWGTTDVRGGKGVDRRFWLSGRVHRPFPAGCIVGLSEAAPEVSVSGFQVRAVVRALKRW